MRYRLDDFLEAIQVPAALAVAVFVAVVLWQHYRVTEERIDLLQQRAERIQVRATEVRVGLEPGQTDGIPVRANRVQ